MEQPSKNETTAQRGSPNPRTERMSLAAYLAAGIGLAGIASTADAAIVNINITDTRGDGNTTTDDDISGVNGNLTLGGNKLITNWLGTGSSNLKLMNAFANRGYTYWGLGNDSTDATALYFAVTGTASPQDFAAGDQIDASASWSNNRWQTVFQYDYQNTATSPDFTAGSYMGIRFGTPGNFNYGWLEVTWDGSTENWQILSGAYESTVNTAIVIPSANVPAPSPASLLALIVGGAALRQWRGGRRKQQLLEQTAA